MIRLPGRATSKRIMECNCCSRWNRDVNFPASSNEFWSTIPKTYLSHIQIYPYIYLLYMCAYLFT